MYQPFTPPLEGKRRAKLALEVASIAQSVIRSGVNPVQVSPTPIAHFIRNRPSSRGRN